MEATCTFLKVLRLINRNVQQTKKLAESLLKPLPDKIKSMRILTRINVTDPREIFPPIARVVVSIVFLFINEERLMTDLSNTFFNIVKCHSGRT